MPEITHENGAVVRVIAGEHDGARGPVADIVAEPLYLDVALPPGADINQPIPAGHTGFAYVFEGEAMSIVEGEPGNGSGTTVPYRTLAILGDGDAVMLHNDTSVPARALLIAGKPIGEPIVRYGHSS